MKRSRADQAFGPVLRQIVKRSADGLHVEKLEDHPEHVCINRTVRYLAKRSRLSGPTWEFTFTPEEQKILFNDLKFAKTGGAYLLLVCKADCACLLRSDEWQKLLQPSEIEGTEWMQVKRPTGCQITVRATAGRTLDHKVPQSRFPDMLLERGIPVPGDGSA
jgi:hypothetical protein